MSYLEWAESQLAEIELLTSMFPSQEELDVTDQLALAELRNYVEGSASADSPPASRPQFLIKQKLPTAGIEMTEVVLSCAYPSEYPSVLPDISSPVPAHMLQTPTVKGSHGRPPGSPVRPEIDCIQAVLDCLGREPSSIVLQTSIASLCSSLSRAQQTEFQAHLNKYLMENCLGEMCVLAAVDWAKDNLQLFINKSLSAAAAPRKESSDARPQDVFSRLWIYSHHIYNKSKRKNILEWSKELGLSGFSMPGKPGVVCVEGPQAACEEFWSRVKVLTWKKIMIRHREDIKLDHQGEDEKTAESINSLRKFTGFEEAAFDPHGNRGNHMDLGQLYQFLNEKGCCDVFQIYFGIEGR